MDRKELREIYNILWSARETVAGGNVQDLPITLNRVKDALGYMASILKRSAQGEMIFCGYGTFLDWTNRVTIAKGLIEQAKDYGDRLEPDRILCDVLNEMMKELD